MRIIPANTTVARASRFTASIRLVLFLSEIFRVGAVPNHDFDGTIGRSVEHAKE